MVDTGIRRSAGPRLQQRVPAAGRLFVPESQLTMKAGENMMLMNKLKKCRRALGVLMVVPTLLVGLNAFALSQDQAAKSAQARQRELTEVPLAKEVRHQLIMLPYYTVFDNLQFRIKNNDTVVLYGVKRRLEIVGNMT
jgi:hypothetical protein